MVVRALLFFITIASFASALAEEPAPTPVFVRTIESQDFVHTIEALGTLKANESVTLSSSVTETISNVKFESGQTVKAGDVLVELSHAEEQALLEEAKFVLTEAEKQYQRIRSLAKSNAASESLLDERLKAYSSAKARFYAVESRFRDRMIVAPFSGVIGLRDISRGTLVTPGDAIATLDDVGVMKLDITIPAMHLSDISTGLTVLAKSPEMNNQEFPGVISHIDTRIDPLTRSIVARAIIPNEQHQLRPGMLMIVQIQSRSTPRIILPEESLISEGFKNYIYRVDAGTQKTVMKQEVTLGPRRLGDVVVFTGVSEGDLVVTHGVQRLRDGATIKIVAEEKGDEPLTELLGAN